MPAKHHCRAGSDIPADAVGKRQKALTEIHLSAIIFVATITTTKGATNMKFVNVRELKNKTSEVLRMAQERDVIVVSRSKPIAIIRHFDEDELEDYVLMNHPDFLARMEKAYQDAKAGKTTDIDAYLASLEAEDETGNAV